MTIDKFLEKKYYEDKNIIKHNNLKNKTLSKIFKLYKNIDVIEYWYDDDENPDELVWQYIEGIGYGWLWLDYKKKDKSLRNKALRNRLIKSALCIHKNEPVYSYTYNDISHYLFFRINEVIEISVSNKELYSFR